MNKRLHNPLLAIGSVGSLIVVHSFVNGCSQLSITSSRFESAAGKQLVRLSLNANEAGLSALLDHFNQDEEIRSTIEVSELIKVRQLRNATEGYHCIGAQTVEV